jgi:hypothetical protein
MPNLALPLTDADYWDEPEKINATSVFKLLRATTPGFTGGAPSQVDLDDHDSLPVVGYFKRTLVDESRRRLSRTTCVVVHRAEGNQVFAGPLFVPLPPGPEATREGSVTTSFCFDACERLRHRLPWRPGSLRVHLVSHDQISAGCQVRLTNKVRDDPAVAEFLDSQRKPSYPAPLSPAPAEDEPYPTYRAVEGSPPLPQEVGIDAQVARVSVLEGEAPCLLQGSFRLPMRESERVKPAPEVEGLEGEALEQALRSLGWRDVGDPEAKAVVAIHLLLAGRDSSTPLVHALRVPVYELDGETATGHFSVDLLSLGLDLKAEGYALYLISGPVTAGPHLASFVTSDMLPQAGE